MRGDEGDLDRRSTHGDRALEVWIPGTRPWSSPSTTTCTPTPTTGPGVRARARARPGSPTETGGLEPHSAEFVLRGAGMEGLILAGMGRYEESLAAGDAAIATARRLGRRDNVVLNYSTTAAARRSSRWTRRSSGARPSCRSARTVRLQHAVDERARRSDRRPPAGGRARAGRAGVAGGVGRRARGVGVGALADHRPARRVPRRAGSSRRATSTTP